MSVECKPPRFSFLIVNKFQHNPGGGALYSDLRSKFNNLSMGVGGQGQALCTVRSKFNNLNMGVRGGGRGAGTVYSEVQVEQVSLNLATGRTETPFPQEQTENITFSSLRWWAVVIVPQYQMSSDA